MNKETLKLNWEKKFKPTTDKNEAKFENNKQRIKDLRIERKQKAGKSAGGTGGQRQEVQINEDDIQNQLKTKPNQVHADAIKKQDGMSETYHNYMDGRKSDGTFSSKMSKKIK